MKNNLTRYNWNDIQKFYDAGNSMRGCVKEFGITMLSLVKAVRRGQLKTRSHSVAMKTGYKLGKIKRAIMSVEDKKARSDWAKSFGLGGETNYNRFKYKNISMDSQWEVDVAIHMDENNIKWVRDKKIFFSWVDEKGESHKYYPDFYLLDFNVYLDPKNKFLIEKDRFKIEDVMKRHNIKIVWGHKDDVLNYLKTL